MSAAVILLAYRWAEVSSLTYHRYCLFSLLAFFSPLLMEVDRHYGESGEVLRMTSCVRLLVLAGLVTLRTLRSQQHHPHGSKTGPIP